MKDNIPARVKNSFIHKPSLSTALAGIMFLQVTEFSNDLVGSSASIAFSLPALTPAGFYNQFTKEVQS